MAVHCQPFWAEHTGALRRAGTPTPLDGGFPTSREFPKRSLDIPGGIIHTVGAMMRFFRSEAGAVLLWVAASLLLAALIVPWLYQGGKGLAELLNAQAGGGVAGWLGQACRRADFGRFFNRSLLLAALVLLPVLWRRLAAFCPQHARNATIPVTIVTRIVARMPPE